MGLCKCRTVTTLFCFEHRRNVCERCVVTDHSQCVVKTYLQWLQDSEFDPNCLLCHQPFAGADGPETSVGSREKVIRLPCFDLFHWNCLERELLGRGEASCSLFKAKCPLCRTPVWPLSPSEPSSLPWSPLLEQIHGILSHSPLSAQLPPLPPPPPASMGEGKGRKERDPLLAGQPSNSLQPNSEMITIEVGPREHFFSSSPSPHSSHGRRPPTETKVHAPPRGRRAATIVDEGASSGTPPMRSVFRVLLNCLTLRNVRILGLGLSPRQSLIIIVLLALLFLLAKAVVLPLLQPVMLE